MSQSPRRNPNPRPSQPPAKPAEPQPERIQKLLARAGLGSRRQIDAWLAAGRITARGQVARPGDRALPGDPIALDGKAIDTATAPAPRVIVYHKPEGEIVTRSDPEGRRTVFERLPRLGGERWVAVGRLDLNSSGLLLFTNSGELANRLMHPRHQVEREYMARVSGELSPEVQKRLLAGIPLEDGLARFERIDPGAKVTGANRWYRVTLCEGRNREVRRLFEAVGMQVSRLVRVRMGSVHLPRTLKPGRWIEIDAADALRRIGAKTR